LTTTVAPKLDHLADAAVVVGVVVAGEDVLDRLVRSSGML
jgi:hypothetical protein